MTYVRKRRRKKKTESNFWTEYLKSGVHLSSIVLFFWKLQRLFTITPTYKTENYFLPAVINWASVAKLQARGAVMPRWRALSTWGGGHGDHWYVARPQTSTIQVFKSWSHGMTNVSVPVAIMLQNSWTLAVSVAINISMELCFVSVNGPRETYFVDDPRT
jgi:hypothetical protein